MRIPNETYKEAELICFYKKGGKATKSPYEAQLWKLQSIPVYARLKCLNGDVVQGLLCHITFKYRHNVSVTIRVGKSKICYMLINVASTTRVLYHDNLYFFSDNKDKPLGTKEALSNVFTSATDYDCMKKVEIAKKEGKIVSIVYEDDAPSGLTIGIIPNVEQYDDEKQLIITRHQSIFILKK